KRRNSLPSPQFGQQPVKPRQSALVSDTACSTSRMEFPHIRSHSQIGVEFHPANTASCMPGRRPGLFRLDIGLANDLLVTRHLAGDVLRKLVGSRADTFEAE